MSAACISTHQHLGGNGDHQQPGADECHNHNHKTKSSSLGDGVARAEDGEDNRREGVLAEGGSGQFPDDTHQPFHLHDSVLVFNISVIVAASTGNWKFAEAFVMQMVMTLSVFSTLLWLMYWNHRRRGSSAWSQTRLFQMFLDDDPIFRPLRNAVLLLTVVGACLALMPQFDPPRLLDGVFIMANLAGFLCAFNLIETWLRTRVLPQEGTR